MNSSLETHDTVGKHGPQTFLNQDEKNKTIQSHMCDIHRGGPKHPQNVFLQVVPGGGGIPLSGLYGEAPPRKGCLF